jgi:YggT family protein
MRCGSVEEIMRFIFGILALITGIYSCIIFIRIILSWFGDMVSGRPIEFINMITDPYLNWWRERLHLTFAGFDFSVIPAIVVLSFAQNIFKILSVSEGITLGFMLAQILLTIWSIFSFILFFFIIMIIIRAIGHLNNSDVYSPFWGFIDSATQPILYRVNRIFTGDKVGSLLREIILSLIFLVILLVGGNLLVTFLAKIIYKLPI